MSWKSIVGAAVLAAAAMLSGCAQSETKTESGAEAAVQTERLTIDTRNGPVSFDVEIADDAAEQERGLMFRREMARDHGMLFDFHEPFMASFWMHNTLISLDIIFIDADGRILNIAESTTPYSDEPINSSGLARGVLEINAGLSRELGIRPGDRVRHRIFER
ncbi:MAG: DUF192 domain-containing protein [Caulobacteraceae bacterium]